MMILRLSRIEPDPTEHRNVYTVFEQHPNTPATETGHSTPNWLHKPNEYLKNDWEKTLKARGFLHTTQQNFTIKLCKRPQWPVTSSQHTISIPGRSATFENCLLENYAKGFILTINTVIFQWGGQVDTARPRCFKLMVDGDDDDDETHFWLVVKYRDFKRFPIQTLLRS